MLATTPLGTCSRPCTLAAVRPARRQRGSLSCRAKAGGQAVPAWQRACAAGALSLALMGPPALAELNRREAAVGGEFGSGSAQQYGEADLMGRDFANQDLRRANFTSADARRADFSNSNLQGAYLIKTVLAQANFEGANLSDVLMDRAVIVEANLRNANLERAVLTRSDLRDAIVEGADFSNALLDKTQQMGLCRYASGTNPVTGVDTRQSLGCGSRRRFRESAPSNPEGPQATEAEKEAFTRTLPKYRQ